ncbi:MAG: hypothetical protein AB7F88_06680 [Pyrinomonadaceae bacterium]
MNGPFVGDEADALGVKDEFDVRAALKAGCYAAVKWVDAPGAAA